MDCKRCTIHSQPAFGAWDRGFEFRANVLRMDACVCIVSDCCLYSWFRLINMIFSHKYLVTNCWPQRPSNASDHPQEWNSTLFIQSKHSFAVIGVTTQTHNKTLLSKINTFSNKLNTLCFWNTGSLRNALCLGLGTTLKSSLNIDWSW